MTILTMINSTKRSIANLQKSYLDHEIMKLTESIPNIVGHEKLIMTDFLRNGMSLYLRGCNSEIFDILKQLFLGFEISGNLLTFLILITMRLVNF